MLLVGLTTFMLALFGSRYTTKPLLVIVLLVSSLVASFMDSYHVVINVDMIRNAMQTDLHESLDLFNPKLLVYFLLLGLFPSYLVYRAPIQYRGLKKELLGKLLTLVLSAVLMAGSMYLFSKHYTSFIREHKPLRYNTNPSYWIYSIVKYLNKTYFDSPIVISPIGKDAKITDEGKPRLLIVVVGEAPRADHFGLNGYLHDTTPKLKNIDLVNFPTFYSCGTSTAHSVPCMFSKFDREAFDYKKGISYENVLDILKHTGKVSILWRDNNSDSKGVALRVPYEDYKSKKHNTICEGGECRDEGMLVGLKQYIQDQNNSNILIVLHQMGNHGPAYYKRYPKQFEKFKPACHTNQLEKCTQEEISNAYDNAIVHTDSFLADTISLLKQFDHHYATGLIYIADHGESLGENGVYLHGMPYFMAPDAQKHVAAFAWLGTGTGIDRTHLQEIAKKPYSQDNLFHMILGFFHVQTREYKSGMDIFHTRP